MARCQLCDAACKSRDCARRIKEQYAARVQRLIQIDSVALGSLSPTAFENLVFDVMRSGMLANLQWRTPGADGGRDIQGEAYDQDVSGQRRLSKWHIECKRYEASVSWPTVWEKVAYADSGSADYLLMVTTSKFTPKCVDEIDRWNAAHRRPLIRAWPEQELIFRLQLLPAIAGKYGLTKGEAPPARSLAQLSLHVAKMAQATAGAVTTGYYVDEYAAAALSLAELLSTRSDDLANAGAFVQRPMLRSDTWPSYVTSRHAVPADMDRFGLTAVLATLRIVFRSLLTVVEATDEFASISIENYTEQRVSAGGEILYAVSMWAGISLTWGEGKVCLEKQTTV